MTQSPPADTAIGNISTLQEGQVLLPSFVVRRSDGIFVDISVLDSPDLLQRFIEHVFGSSARFDQLDYSTFLKLVFEYTPSDIDRLLQRFETEGRKPEVRLAAGIVDFPHDRQEIYRGLKIDSHGENAEYIFEQVCREVEYQEMTYGESDAGGMRPETGYVTRTRVQRMFLDFDEFVAAAWMKGLHYGIDEVEVRASIAADKNERLLVAQQKPPEPGRDASVEECSTSLHRDDTPRLLPNGRVDLAQYSNRFPQVDAGTVLFRKLPRQPGVSGWSVSGTELPPEPVKDFDLDAMAGPGTRVAREENGDYCIVATMDGFLNIDKQSSQVSVSDKIINRAGVSARTTGNLDLAGDEFEEHGEVQEKRVVSGYNMTFCADVFGDIVSDGGRILFKKSISGGSATSHQGVIKIEGKASSATLIARDGEIEAAAAEGSLLKGRTVRVTQAIRCDILADEVIIEQAEGCTIAARKVQIGRAGARKSFGTQVLLFLPDLASYDKDIVTAEGEAGQLRDEVAGRSTLMANLTAEPDLKTFLALQPKIKSGVLAMNPGQESNWKTLQTRVAPMLRELTRHKTEIEGLRSKLAGIEADMAVLRQERAVDEARVGCQIEQVFGETVVKGRHIRLTGLPLDALAPKDLRAKLRETLSSDESLYAGEIGCFYWPAEE